MGEGPADPLPQGWQEPEQGPGMARSSGIASHARRGAQPQPGDEDQMSARSQGAGKAVTSAQPGSSRVPAKAGTDPPPSPRLQPPGPTSTALCRTERSVVPLPAPTAAPPLPPFGVQMAGDGRE